MFHVEHLPGVCNTVSGPGGMNPSPTNLPHGFRVVVGGGVPDAPREFAWAAAFWDNAAVGQTSAEGSRPLPTDGVHGCFVGNGLDRSGDVCRCCMVKYCCGVGAAYMRPGSVRETGAYGKPAGGIYAAPTVLPVDARVSGNRQRRGQDPSLRAEP